MMRPVRLVGPDRAVDSGPQVVFLVARLLGLDWAVALDRLRDKRLDWEGISLVPAHVIADNPGVYLAITDNISHALEAYQHAQTIQGLLEAPEEITAPFWLALVGHQGFLSRPGVMLEAGSYLWIARQDIVRVRVSWLDRLMWARIGIYGRYGPVFTLAITGGERVGAYLYKWAWQAGSAHWEAVKRFASTLGAGEIAAYARRMEQIAREAEELWEETRLQEEEEVGDEG